MNHLKKYGALPSLSDFNGASPGDNISRSEIFGGGGISLHVSLTLGVDEVATLTTRALSDKTTSSINTYRNKKSF